MNTKTFSGKAIYQPAGKAAEYAEYACNFYVGCSCGCHYCFNKKGRFEATTGGDTPTLKKSFKNEEHALEVFEKELQANLPELQKHGLFFTFTSDPFLDESIDLTTEALMIAMKNQVYCKILTKIANYNIDRFINNNFIRNGIWAKPENFKKYVAFGFTLTGHDELEPGASTNDERIKAMRKLHDAGFKTFCSAEPIIDFESSKDVMCSAMDCCDLYKIGLESGKKYDKNDLKSFVDWVLSCNRPNNPKFYFKDSLLKSAGISRSELPDNCITKDYDIFNNK